MQTNKSHIWTENIGSCIRLKRTMIADPQSLRTAYAAEEALDYIAALMVSADRPSPSVSGLDGERIQPTIGSHAAALLDVLVRARRPRRILEIGTSFGYSACVLGRAAAAYGGTVLTIEKNPCLATAAQDYFARAGLQHSVEVLTGDARQIVPTLDGFFGLILQDGGKEDYQPLLNPLVTLLETAGLLVSDDVLFPVISLPESAACWGKAVADYNRALRDHSRLRTTWLPIGDGIALSVKVS
jgi:predicted O-methyltransferase YrrM